jgi:hypothetical protein
MCNGVVFVPEGAAAKGQTNKSNGIQKQDAKSIVHNTEPPLAFPLFLQRAACTRVSLFQRFPLKIGNQCAESTSPPEAHLLNFYIPPLSTVKISSWKIIKKLRVIKKAKALLKSFILLALLYLR